MIRTENLTISLAERAVLRDATLEFRPGRVTVVLGPNGAGKSSLMRAIAGLLPSENIFLDDQRLTAIPLRERAQRIGYLPQNGAPAWNISARDLVALGRLPHRAQFAAESALDRNKVEAALIATDTDRFADRTVEALSGGELARVKLARLIAGDPDWVLADEPLANLDPAHQRAIVSLLRQIATSGKGVILILHQLDAALNVADDVVLLKDGLVVVCGPTKEIMNQANLEKLFDTGFVSFENGGRSAVVQSWKNIPTGTPG